MVRKHIHFRGRVQGVGFRFTTQMIASHYPVVGFVKNLPSGEVELVVEGQDQVVQAFLDELRTKMRDNIAEEVDTETPAAGQFTRFEIRY